MALNYKDLNMKEKRAICSGCGAKAGGRKPPCFRFFEASCDMHDFGYWVGGDEDRRSTCDARFYQAMLRDANRLGRWYNPKKVWFKWLARRYYKAVVRYGVEHFYYTDTPRVMADVQKYVRGYGKTHVWKKACEEWVPKGEK